METGLLRVILLAVLLFLLTADHGAYLGELYRAFGGGGGGEDEDSRPRGPASRADVKDAVQMISTAARARLLHTIKNVCLPKLICELNAAPHREKLTDSEKSLLSLISDTSISVTAAVTSKYHFAAHMGQLIAGVDGAGCHNFYPSCPLPGLQVLNMMKKIRIR
ncbi:uncharacterized protein LOC134527614 [Bacillus rossius redtenbacheri]|uniref:uncharacterized protein LOC134527614 n=1 Tax=Bacillus rossius redtenbacheri TaxID=93214 RepID=UPI002FDE887C